ncbi:hypothetical protein B1R32_11420 [Abditibacterium utsteinense]|uniref:Uncharacterized protein n=1 Tax=Abditibacterium utsteinense TaxID=1960156 RepID=A0A2S8SQY6_9BACT|nr:hypothetical protein [Abditibacterium utsteinense]PQV63195.1 hypothetical protein B1R32_11420 [Abditibacterium utsteinense]
MATADFPSSRPQSPPASDSNFAAGAALQSRLGVLSRRRNAQKMSRALTRAAIPGVALAAATVLLYKLHILADGPIWAPVAIIGFSLLWGLKNGFAQRAGSFAAACDADRALGLNDRLASALSFVAPAQIQRQILIAPQAGRISQLRSALFPKFALSTAPVAAPTNLVPALVDEAALRAQNLDPKRVYPLPFNRSAQVLALLSILFAGFVLMPDMPIFQSEAQKKQVAAMQAAGEKLIVVAKTVQKTAPPKAEAEKQLARQLEKLGQKMVRGRMTKRAALTEIGELKNQLEKAKQKNSAAQSGQLPQIAEALRDAPLQSSVGRKVQQQLGENKAEEAAKSLEKLADQLEKGEVSQAEKKKAAEDLQKTAQDLRSRGGEANKKAADQLEQAAKQLQSQGQQSPQNQQNDAGQKQQSGQKNPSQQGQNPQNQGQPKQNQSGPQGLNQQKQSPNQQGQQSQQNQSGGQQQGQKGQNQQQQGGQKGGGEQSGQGEQQSGQQGEQGAADALRDMASGLRQGGASGQSSQNLQDMLSKMREAENQTGSNGGQQFGQGKPGSTSLKAGSSECPPGADCRQGMKPGKDLISTDPHGLVKGGAGLGPRNNAQGVQKGGGVSNKKSERTGDKRRYEDVWSDRLPKTRAKIDRIKGKWGGSGEIEQMPTKGEGKGGQVKTPYYEVYESYKRDAEEAVGRENVPPAYKQPVKDYFESIKP